VLGTQAGSRAGVVKPSAVPLTVLVSLAVLSPWPMGSVPPLAGRVLAAAALATSLGCCVLWGARGRLAVPTAASLWPLLALFALGVFQLLPVPAALHALAPGSREVWHPASPEAAAVLGPGLHPVSVLPAATAAWLGLATALAGLALLAGPACDAEGAPRAATAAVAGAFAVSVYAVVAPALFGPLLFGRVPVPTLAPAGPFVSKNHFAGYAEMGTLLALGLAAGLYDRERSGGPAWTESPRGWQIFTAMAAALAMGLSVLASLSRGGALSLAAGLVVFGVLRTALSRRGARGGVGRIVGMAAAVLLALAAVSVLPRAAQERIGTLGTASREQAGAFRLRVWRDAAGMALASPILGHGLGAFAAAFPRYKTSNGELRVEHAENDYLETLAEGGLLGLGAALAAVALGWRAAVAGLGRQHDRLRRGIGVGSLAGLAALLVHSAFDFNLRIPSNATLFALLAALALGSASGPRPLGRSAALLFGALLLLGGAAVLWPPGPTSLETPRQGLGTAHALADPVARRLRLARAEEVLLDRVGRSPAEAEAWFLLGWSRALEGRPEGLALARYGATLDPTRVELTRELGRLASAGRRAP
jgi:hypothetical protein